MSSRGRPVLMANVPGNLDEMATKAAFNVYYERLSKELAPLPCLSLEDAIKRGNEAASRWLENQKNEIPSAAVVKAFDEDCADFQGLKNSDKAVVQAFMQTHQPNQQSSKIFKQQLLKLDGLLHQNIAMQHHLCMLVNNRRQMSKTGQKPPTGDGGSNLATNLPIKQLEGQGVDVTASTTLQNPPLERATRQRINTTPKELTGNIIMFIQEAVEKYTGAPDNEAIKAGCVMASRILGLPDSPYDFTFFEIMERYARNIVLTKVQEKSSEGEESLDRYKKAIQPVILYFASAKKCCEELLVDVAEEKGELADGEAQQTAESTQKNDEAKQQQQNKKKKKKKKKGKGKK